MRRYDDIYSLFRECFPQLTASYDSFTRLLKPDECEIIKRTENGAVIGFGIRCGEHIRLLCVAPDSRGKGIGSDILSECENMISSADYEHAVLGEDSWFFLGAVLSEDKWDSRSSDFFEKRGYVFSDSCMEMSAKAAELDMGSVPHTDAEHRFIRPDEHDMLISAVARVDKDWCRYFSDDTCTFASLCGNEIVSFCIAEDHCTTLITGEGINIGSVGCVGTVPEMRKKGYGLAMVAAASDILRNRGCSDIYIHYTGLDKWYGKLGFKPLIRFATGKKLL